MMLFGQLSNRDSLRDLVTIIEAHKSKAYHLGFGCCINLSTLSKANVSRNYRIFEEFAMHMINYARRLRANAEFEVKTEGNIYAFDSSIISLCLSVFRWATYKRNSGAVRLHTMLDIRTQIPCFMLVTPASTNDIKAMEHIPYEQGSFYIFDRGYNSFADLYRIHRLEAFLGIISNSNEYILGIVINKVLNATKSESSQQANLQFYIPKRFVKYVIMTKIYFSD